MRIDVLELPAAVALGTDAPAVAVRATGARGQPLRLELAASSEVELLTFRAAAELVSVAELAADEPPLRLVLAPGLQLFARRSRALSTLEQAVRLVALGLEEV